MIRTKRRVVAFPNAFRLKALDHEVPAGDYEVITDEELIEGISFPVYRRVASWIIVPGKSNSTEMVTLDAADIAAALQRGLGGADSFENPKGAREA